MLDYDKLAHGYEIELTEKLRGFNTEHEFLGMWVHDSDDTLSLLNMMESALAFGQKNIQISLSQSTLDKIDLNKLKTETKSFAQIEVKKNNQLNYLEVKFL